MALDRQRGRRGGGQLAELVPHHPFHPQVHGEHPRPVVLAERVGVQVQAHQRSAHEQRRRRVRAPRALERQRQRGAAEAHALVQPLRPELVVVVDGHAPVGVRDGQRRREVVRERRGGRRGGAEVEAGERRGGDGDLDRPGPVDEPDEEREGADEKAHVDGGSDQDAEQAQAAAAEEEQEGTGEGRRWTRR